MTRDRGVLNFRNFEDQEEICRIFVDDVGHFQTWHGEGRQAALTKPVHLIWI